MAKRVQHIGQKIPAAFSACLAFVSGIVLAHGGTVSRAVFVVSFLILLFYRRWGFSARTALFLASIVVIGYGRAHLPLLIVPLPHALTTFLSRLHATLAAPFANLFSPDEASLATGLTIGADVTFSNTLRAAMRASGTTHLVALSGYNVSIIVTNLLALLTHITSRRAASWIAGTGIVLFTLTAGTQPSLVRAACMGVLALAAHATGRRYRIAHALGYVAALMLLFDPMLITNLGALLSFASLLGVAYIGPVLPFPEPSGSRFKDIVIEQVQTTTAAQLAVLPLALASFGKTNVLSVVANTIILPVVPFTMFVAMLTSLAAVFVPIVVFIPAFVLHLLLMYILSIVKLFSHIVIPITWQMTTLEAVCISSFIALGTWYAYYIRRQANTV